MGVNKSERVHLKPPVFNNGKWNVKKQNGSEKIIKPTSNLQCSITGMECENTDGSDQIIKTFALNLQCLIMGMECEKKGMGVNKSENSG